MASDNFQALLNSWIYEQSSAFPESSAGVDASYNDETRIGDGDFMPDVMGAYGDESNFWLLYTTGTYTIIVKTETGGKVVNVYDFDDNDYYGLCYTGSYFWMIAKDDYTGDYKCHRFDEHFVAQGNDSGDLDTDGNDPWFISITYDGTYFYLLDDHDNYVYKYDSSWNYQTRYALDANNSDPKGIVHDTEADYSGGNSWEFYVTDQSDANLYCYDSSFNLQNTDDVSYYRPSPYAIANSPDWSGNDGVAVFAEDVSSHNIEWTSYGYWGSWTALEYKNINLVLNNDPKGITHNGSNYYVIETDPEVIVEYDSTFTVDVANNKPTVYDLDELSSGANLDPRGIYHDGTYAYVVDGDGNCYKYDLSTPALSATNSLNVGNSDPLGITSDGSSFWIMDGDGNVYEYNSSWTYQTSYSVGIDGWGIEYDGSTYFYIEAGGNIYEFDSSFNQIGSDVLTNIVGTPKGLCYDGTYYVLIDDNGYNSDAIEYIFEHLSNFGGLTVSGHTKVMDADDYTHTFGSAQTDSVFEIWGYVTDITKASKIIFKDGSGNECITVKFDASKIYGDAGDTGLSPSNYTWYRFTIDFDCSANTYDLDVGGTNQLTGQAFGTADDGSGLTEVQFVRADSTYHFYVAHIGEVWDADYSEGDNSSDQVDITDDVIKCKVHEKKGQSKYANLDFKSSVSEYFEAGHTVKIYDKDSVLSFAGEILSPTYSMQGKAYSKGKTKLVGKDKQLDNVFHKNFTTARSSDYMLKHIIDNHLTFYHSYDDEIDDFSSLTFKYDLKKPIRKFIFFLEMLERAVIHSKPDGEFIFNAHDNLTATGFTWTHGTTSGVKITQYTPNANRYITRATVSGAHNSEGKVYVVGTPDNQTALENQFGINALPTWRDAEITNYSEADQLATNLQTIHSQNTKFITVLTKGKGHIQVGYTISFASSKPFEISRDDFLVISRTWDPVNDISTIKLTDNILTEGKFNVNVVNKIYDDEAQAGFEDSEPSETSSDGTVETLKSVQSLRTNALVNYSEFLLDDDLGSDHSYNGVVTELTNSQSFGDAVYISSANTVGQADADATSTMPCIGISVASNKVLTWGVVRDDSWSWSAGDILYVSTTAGSLTATAPSGSDDQVQVVGIAISSAEVLVIPSMVLVEVA